MNHTHTMSMRMIFLLAFATVTVAFFFVGCGGSSNGNAGLPTSVTGAAWKQVGATYVGRARCRDCHSRIDDEYATQNMGDATSRMATANCNSCHTTGYGEASGFKTDGSTPHLDGIGCEDCHGPGSKHIAANTIAERKATITRTPSAKKACWACHGDRIATPSGVYLAGAVFQPVTAVTAATLHDTAPSKIVTPHHTAALILAGMNGYNVTGTLPSPHSTLPNTCLDCHKPGISGTTGQVDHGVNALEPNLDTSRAECASCHNTREIGTPLQTGIKSMLIQLAGEDPAKPGYPDRLMRGGLLPAYVAKYNIALNTNLAPDDPHVIAYKAARYNFDYVRSEGSYGVHNPGLATRLLNEAINMLK